MAILPSNLQEKALVRENVEQIFNIYLAVKKKNCGDRFQK